MIKNILNSLILILLLGIGYKVFFAPNENKKIATTIDKLEYLEKKHKIMNKVTDSLIELNTVLNKLEQKDLEKVVSDNQLDISEFDRLRGRFIRERYIGYYQEVEKVLDEEKESKNKR